MIFQETPLKGAYLVYYNPLDDERGYFARTFCQREFAERGLNTSWVQSNLSYNRRKGTLRGMHYQDPPFAEVKLIHCIQGAVYDVITDLRKDSPTYKQWFHCILSANQSTILYVPKGFAHGFLSLEDETLLLYQMGDFFHPDSQKGIRWNDPSFQIQWPPCNEYIISEKDRSYPDFA